MTNENKLAAMDAVGELPDFGNLLLREGGFPHLPASQSDAWNEAGTKPDHPCLCETFIDDFNVFQYFDGYTFGMVGCNKEEAIEGKHSKSIFQFVQWREVQP